MDTSSQTIPILNAKAARKVFTKCRKLIKDNLKLSDEHLDYLQQDILSENEVQLVQSTRTNTRQISVLLDILQMKGPDGLQYFLEALIHTKYPYLVCRLTEKYEIYVEETKRLESTCTETDEDLGYTSLDNRPAVAKIDKGTNTDHLQLGSGYFQNYQDFSDAHRNTMIINKIYSQVRSHLTLIHGREITSASPTPQCLNSLESVVNAMIDQTTKCHRLFQNRGHHSLYSCIKQLIDMLEETNLAKNKMAHRAQMLETKCRNYEHQMKLMQDKINKLNKTAAPFNKPKNITNNAHVKDKDKDMEEIIKKYRDENEILKQKVAQLQEQTEKLLTTYTDTWQSKNRGTNQDQTTTSIDHMTPTSPAKVASPESDEKENSQTNLKDVFEVSTTDESFVTNQASNAPEYEQEKTDKIEEGTENSTTTEDEENDKSDEQLNEELTPLVPADISETQPKTVTDSKKFGCTLSNGGKLFASNDSHHRGYSQYTSTSQENWKPNPIYAIQPTDRNQTDAHLRRTPDVSKTTTGTLQQANILYQKAFSKSTVAKPVQPTYSMLGRTGIRTRKKTTFSNNKRRY